MLSDWTTKPIGNNGTQVSLLVVSTYFIETILYFVIDEQHFNMYACSCIMYRDSQKIAKKQQQNKYISMYVICVTAFYPHACEKG